MFEKVPGKYDLVKIDYSKGNDTPDSAAAVKKAKERVSIGSVMVVFELLTYSWSITFFDIWWNILRPEEECVSYHHPHH